MSHSRLLARIMGKFLKFSNDVKLHVDMIYPVGSIYMSVNDVSPATLFGGTWEQIKDKFLLASGDTYANGSTGGEATHTLTVDEMPSHNHTANQYNAYCNNTGDIHNTASGSGWYFNQKHIVTDSTGGGKAHNNMPPYLTVNVWKRTK